MEVETMKTMMFSQVSQALLLRAVSKMIVMTWDRELGKYHRKPVSCLEDLMHKHLALRAPKQHKTKQNKPLEPLCFNKQ